MREYIETPPGERIEQSLKKIGISDIQKREIKPNTKSREEKEEERHKSIIRILSLISISISLIGLRLGRGKND